MADKALEDYLDDVLNNRISVIPKLADLPSLWREASAEASDSSHSGDPDRLTWLAMYIDMADTKPWARDGLRGLLQELLENGETSPCSLELLGPPSICPGRPCPQTRPTRRVRAGLRRSCGFPRCCGLKITLVKPLWTLSQT